MFRCPDDSVSDTAGPMNPGYWNIPPAIQFHTSYLYNTDIGGVGLPDYKSPASLASVNAPASTVLALDGASWADSTKSPSAWTQKNHAFLIYPTPADNNQPESFDYDAGGPLPRHADGLNVLWADGHVKYQRLPNGKFYDPTLATGVKAPCFDVTQGCQ